MKEGHPFTLEIDIIQFDRDSNRVIVKGYLGENLETEYVDEVLMIHGSEANIFLHISKEELHRMLRIASYQTRSNHMNKILDVL